MSIKTKFAFGFYLFCALVGFAFGLIYLFSPKFMPYHEAAVGLSWGEVDSAFQAVILSFMRVVGGGLLATMAAIYIFLFIPFRRGDKWARWAIPVVLLIFNTVSLYVMLIMKFNTPASPPWMVSALLIVLSVVGYILSSDLGK